MRRVPLLRMSVHDTFLGSVKYGGQWTRERINTQLRPEPRHANKLFVARSTGMCEKSNQDQTEKVSKRAWLNND